MRKFIFFIYLLSIPGLSLAQQFQGVIKTPVGEAVGFATIAVLNTNRGAVADDRGNFSLALSPGTYQLEIKAVGFATKIEKISFPDQVGATIILTRGTEKLDEVVVTAQKSEENIIETPISVTSIDAAKIQDTRIWELANLTGLVPNYNYAQLGSGYQQLQSIRGVQVFSDDPAVATYIDGVNALDIASNGFQLMDIERIEVLKGPQGTLYGRNAMGGVINIITKKPTNRQSGFFEASVGNLGLQRYGIGYRQPLVEDKLFMGVSGQFQRRHGYFTNDRTGTDQEGTDIDGARVGDEDSYYGNFFLTWLPSDRLKATLNVKGQSDNSPEGSSFFTRVDDEVTAVANPDKIFLNRLGSSERNIVNTSLDLSYYVGNFTLSSITSYQAIRTAFEEIDFVGINTASFYDNTLGGTNPQNVFSQEFRISSANPEERLQYTAGAFYFNQDNGTTTGNFATVYDAGEFAPLGFDNPEIRVAAQNNGDNRGFAFFGQVSYDLTQKLTLTAGMRYDNERRETTFSTTILDDRNDPITDEDVLNALADLFIANNIPEETVNGDFDAFSPKLALSYQLQQNASVYASYTRGFRTGGVNPVSRTSLIDASLQTFEPETSDNFEAGYKTSLFEGRIFLAASLFHINWSDLQYVSRFPSGDFVTNNVGDARSSGIELEVNAIPLKNLELDMSLGINDTEYNDFILGSFDFSVNEPIEVEISGNQLAVAPAHTIFLGAQYKIPVTGKLALVLRGEWRNIGDQYFDIENTLEQPAYSLFNTRVGCTSGWFDAFFWVQNIADERYIGFGTPITTGGFGRSTLMAPPRTLGVTLTTKF